MRKETDIFQKESKAKINVVNLAVKYDEKLHYAGIRKDASSHKYFAITDARN